MLASTATRHVGRVGSRLICSTWYGNGCITGMDATWNFKACLTLSSSHGSVCFPPPIFHMLLLALHQHPPTTSCAAVATTTTAILQRLPATPQSRPGLLGAACFPPGALSLELVIGCLCSQTMYSIVSRSWTLSASRRGNRPWPEGGVESTTLPHGVYGSQSTRNNNFIRLVGIRYASISLQIHGGA